MSKPTLPPSADWHPVLRQLFERYRDLGTAHAADLQCCLGDDLAARVPALSQHAIDHLHELSEDKANRWLGFVQGVLVVAGVITIDGERDFTRPLFHSLRGPSRSHDAGQTP